MTARTELAWSAGFYDGEGNTRWGVTYTSKRRRSRTYGTFKMQVAQIHREVLDRFKTAVGVGNVLGPYQKKNRTGKDYFVWTISGPSALSAFHLIRPFLSSKKKEQGDLAETEYWKQKERPKLGGGHAFKAAMRANAS